MTRKRPVRTPRTAAQRARMRAAQLRRRRRERAAKRGAK